MKDVVIIGGPNGAGKTTAANRLLPTALELREFLNADEIARGLSPFNPEANAVPADRMMIDRIDKLVGEGRSFAFETTCAGHRQAKLLRSCRTAGYRVTFVFLWLPSSQFAVERVAQRVVLEHAQGAQRGAAVGDHRVGVRHVGAVGAVGLDVLVRIQRQA